MFDPHLKFFVPYNLNELNISSIHYASLKQKSHNLDNLSVSLIPATENDMKLRRRGRAVGG